MDELWRVFGDFVLVYIRYQLLHSQSGAKLVMVFLWSMTATAPVEQLNIPVILDFSPPALELRIYKDVTEPEMGLITIPLA